MSIAEKEYTLVVELQDSDGGEWIQDWGIIAKSDAEAITEARKFANEMKREHSAKVVAWYALDQQGVVHW